MWIVAGTLCTGAAQKTTELSQFPMARHLLNGDDCQPEGVPMRHRKRRGKVAVQHRDHRRQMLLAVLYLCGVLLLINAWLVSQQLLRF